MNKPLTPEDMDLADLIRIIDLDADLVGRVKESMNSVAGYVELHNAPELAESLREIAAGATALGQKIRQQSAKMKHPHYRASLSSSAETPETMPETESGTLTPDSH